MKPAMDEIYRVQKFSMREEWRREQFFLANGGTVAWKKTHDFGSRKKSVRTLRRKGLLFNAVFGRGPGHIKEVTRNSMAIGTKGSVVPYAKHIRGGTGLDLDRSDMIIRPRKKANNRSGRVLSGPFKWAMGVYLLFRYGVALTEEKLLSGLRVPRRPYGVVTAKGVSTFVRVLADWVTVGDIRTARVGEFTP